MTEVTSVDMKAFAEHHPRMWSQMHEYGWDTLEGLRAPVVEHRIPDGPYKGQEFRAAEHGWEALWTLHSVGPRRILNLVNFLRDRGVELPWFAGWDESSANWTDLDGCRRAEPCPGR
jgi:hypothetical protein